MQFSFAGRIEDVCASMGVSLCRVVQRQVNETWNSKRTDLCV